MNIAHRHQQILNRVKTDSHVSVSEISKELDVSEVTIRKDLKYLEEKGLLFRHHGGASLSSPYVTDKPLVLKSSINKEQKSAIASVAVTFIEDNDVIIMGSGTSVMAMADFFPADKNITVITSSLVLSARLCQLANVTVIQLGGSVRKSSQSTVGPLSQQTIQEFSASKLFMGVDGLDAVFGISTSNMDEAYLNQLMIKNSNKTYVLCDASKFGKKGLSRIGSVGEADCVITDTIPDDRIKAVFEKLSIELIVTG